LLLIPEGFIFKMDRIYLEKKLEVLERLREEFSGDASLRDVYEKVLEQYTEKENGESEEKLKEE